MKGPKVEGGLGGCLGQGLVYSYTEGDLCGDVRGGQASEGAKGIADNRGTPGQKGARSRIGDTCLVRLFLARVQESPGEWVPPAWTEQRWPGTGGHSRPWPESLEVEPAGLSFVRGGESDSFLVVSPHTSPHP